MDMRVDTHEYMYIYTYTYVYFICIHYIDYIHPGLSRAQEPVSPCPALSVDGRGTQQDIYSLD